MREAQYQRLVIQRIHETWERPLVLKNDAQLVQGIPDLTVILPDFIFFAEIKISADAPFQPNQEYYLELLERMGHVAVVIFPENEEEVFRALRANTGHRR